MICIGTTALKRHTHYLQSFYGYDDEESQELDLGIHWHTELDIVDM